MAISDKFLQSKSSGTAPLHNSIHTMLMLSKLSHYKTRSFAAHEAFGRIYSGLNDLADEITEKLIGYTGEEIGKLEIGTVTAMEPAALGDHIIREAATLKEFAVKGKYEDIENLAQSLSGLGSQLKYLSRFA